MKTHQKPFVALLPCLLFFTAFAQLPSAKTDSLTADTVKYKPLLKLSVNYNTGLNYYGRTDSLKSSGFFPLAEFWFARKFYVNAAPVFVNNAVQHFEYAGTVATAGYQSVTRKWITGVYVSKPFYKSSSELVQSALKAQSGVNLSFLNKFVNLNAGGDIKFSDKTDYGASGGIDHLIRIENKDKSILVFDPSFFVYAGTQNFQRSYTKKTSGGNLLLPTTNEQVITEQTTRFNVLSYEASMPLVYIKARWTFIALPAYVLPQNLVTVSGRPDLSEKGENIFYATLTAKYTF